MGGKIAKMIIRADDEERGDEPEEADFKQAEAEGIIFHPAGMRRDATSGNEKIAPAAARPAVLAR